MVTGGERWRAEVVGHDLASDCARLVVTRRSDGDGAVHYLKSVGGSAPHFYFEPDPALMGPEILVPSGLLLPLAEALNRHLFSTRPAPAPTAARDVDQLVRWFEDERRRVDRLIGALAHEVGVVDPNGGAGALR